MTRKWLFLMLVIFLMLTSQGDCVEGEKLSEGGALFNKRLDVMLVLDNSGSMKKNDPEFLLKNVVTEFLADLKMDWRIGMVIFDQGVRLAEPLVEMDNQDSRNQFENSIEKITYDGLLSNTPGAIERALYELKMNGRKDARKIIILLTDGIVDTGNKQKDIAREKWLKENLTAMSNKSGIRIFGIAFTDAADFSLIQTLAQKTNGEYFRAQKAEDIGTIIDTIDKMISRPPAESDKADIKIVKTTTRVVQESPAMEKAVVKVSPSHQVAPPPPLKKTDLKTPKPVPSESKIGSLYLILTGIIIILLIIIIVIIQRGKAVLTEPGVGRPVVHEKKSLPIPRAEMIDVKNITGEKTLIMEKETIAIGRDKNNDISIPEKTVSSFHATIEFRNGFFFLEDQRSKNKTYLNGQEIHASSPVKLKSGDNICFNTHKFIFILPDLIPAGKTVVNFSGKTHPPVADRTVDEKVAAGPGNTVSFPRGMLIDTKNITGKKTFTLSESTTNIGRDIHNDISLPVNEISGFHATIAYKEGAFYLEDQRSKNKTFLNGDEIDFHKPYKLKSGDEIMFFNYKFIFLIERQLPTGDTGDRH